MKVRNAGVGMKVQVKRDCRGYGDEFIEEGLVYNVSRIDYTSITYELRLVHPDIDGGFAWVNASDVRRYKEAVPEVPQDDMQVGDIVELREECTAKHGELIPQGLYIVGFIDEFDDTCTVLTVHGDYGCASLPMAKVRKVGVCNATNG